MASNPTAPLALTLSTGTVLISRCEDWGWVGLAVQVRTSGPKCITTVCGRPGEWGAKGSRKARAEVTNSSWIETTEALAAEFFSTLQALWVKHGKPSPTSFQDQDGYRFYQAAAVSALRSFAA